SSTRSGGSRSRSSGGPGRGPGDPGRRRAEVLEGGLQRAPEAAGRPARFGGSMNVRPILLVLAGLLLASCRPVRDTLAPAVAPPPPARVSTSAPAVAPPPAPHAAAEPPLSLLAGEEPSSQEEEVHFAHATREGIFVHLGEGRLRASPQSRARRRTEVLAVK